MKVNAKTQTMKVDVETHTKHVAKLTVSRPFGKHKAKIKVALELPYCDPYDSALVKSSLEFQFNDDGTIIGAYLINDEFGYDHYELPEGCHFHEFVGDEKSRRSWSEEEADGEYELGNLEFYWQRGGRFGVVAFDIVDSVDDADGILTIPDDVPEEYRRQFAEGVLTEYGHVCSGETYAFVTVKWGTDGEIVNEEACWGYHGTDYAHSVLADCAALMADNRFVY